MTIKTIHQKLRISSITTSRVGAYHDNVQPQITLKRLNPALVLIEVGCERSVYSIYCPLLGYLSRETDDTRTIYQLVVSCSRRMGTFIR